MTEMNHSLSAIPSEVCTGLRSSVIQLDHLVEVTGMIP